MSDTLIMFVIVFFACALLVMFVYGYKKAIKSISKLNDIKQRLAVNEANLINKDRAFEELKKTLKQKDDTYHAQRLEIENKLERIVELETLLKNEKRLSEEKVKLLEKAESKMSMAFQNLSNKIFEEKSNQLVVQNKESIGAVLSPLREQLGGFRKKIEDVYDKETKDRLSLYHEITHLKSLNEKMSQDAINLTNALKGGGKIQGDWGEMVLERVLEVSGLENGREYDLQVVCHDENHKLYRPDVIVHLPGKRDVIIDAKVSLSAYEKYSSIEDEQEKSQFIKAHLHSIRTHINSLKDKNYHNLAGINSLDMVFMFVPVEPALMLALSKDDTLLQYAFSHRIFLVSPSTLTMNLQIIHNMWRHEYQTLNVMKIAKQAGDLYDKFAGFVTALEDVGDKLKKTKTAYDTVHNRLTSGRGNLIARVESIRKLGGLKTNKQLSDKLIDTALDQD